LTKTNRERAADQGHRHGEPEFEDETELLG